MSIVDANDCDRVAATLYHVFLAEDNSPELFAQFKRVHSLVPYTALKQVIRFANPAAVMSGVLDLFLAQPFGAKSLLQRIFGLALNDGIRSVGKSVETLQAKISEPVFCEKIKNYVNGNDKVKAAIREEAKTEQVDLVIAVLRSDQIQPELEPHQTEQAFNAYVAWNNAVENVSQLITMLDATHTDSPRLTTKCANRLSSLPSSNNSSNSALATVTNR